MNPPPMPRRLALTLTVAIAAAAMLAAPSAFAQTGSITMCTDIFLPARKAEKPFTLEFNPSSQESIVDAIASVPLKELRGPISEVLRPAEALLRMRRDSPARRLIVNRLFSLRLLEGKRYTVEHSWAVATLGVRLGKAAGMSTDELITLFYSGLAHDLGKAIVPDEVLNKPDRLNETELQQMRHHAVALKIILEERAKGDPELQNYIDIGGDHHERWDGQGYPAGKAGTDITRASRILGITDAFHAMTSDRPYRAGMPLRKVIDILSKEAQSGQFDPELLELFLNQVRQEAN